MCVALPSFSLILQLEEFATSQAKVLEDATASATKGARRALEDVSF